MSFSKNILALSIAVALTGAANADSILTGTLTADDNFSVYLSEADNTQGILIKSAGQWETVETINATLQSGNDYFLHIYANDTGGHMAAVLGQFNLTGSHVFTANGTQSLLTNANDWKVSTAGWNNYVNAVKVGDYSSSPWNSRMNGNIDQNADWIWTAKNALGEGYFTVKIEASEVPVPAAAWLFGSAILGLAGIKRKS